MPAMRSCIFNPPGVDSATRRRTLDRLNSLNRERLSQVGDPEIATRMAQYELAFRMLGSVPELLDVSRNPSTCWIPTDRMCIDWSYAANCLLARYGRGCAVCATFHMGWDHHGGLPKAVAGQYKDTDQPTAALLNDLEQRGLLKDTLVVWAASSRTVYSQGIYPRPTTGAIIIRVVSPCSWPARAFAAA